MHGQNLIGLVCLAMLSCAGDSERGSCYPLEALCADPPTGSCFPREELCYELYQVADNNEAPEDFCKGIRSEYQPKKVCPAQAVGGCLQTITTGVGEVERLEWWYLSDDPAFPSTPTQVESACEAENGTFIP